MRNLLILLQNYQNYEEISNFIKLSFFDTKPFENKNDIISIIHIIKT